jgi:hypothetical protein
MLRVGRVGWGWAESGLRAESIFSHFQHFLPFSAFSAIFSSCLVLAVLSRLTCLWEHFQPFSAFSAIFSIFSHFQQLPCFSCSVQADLPQNFFTDNSTCQSLKLILKRSALSPLSAHPQPTLSPPLSHPHVTLTLFLWLAESWKMDEKAENGWKC